MSKTSLSPNLLSPGEAGPRLGFVIQAEPDAPPVVETSEGQRIPGTLSVLFNIRQVRAALDIAPLKCAYLVDAENTACLIGIFPNREQQPIFAEVALEGTRVTLRSGQALIEVHDGAVKLHAQDVSFASDGELRMAGIRVRMN